MCGCKKNQTHEDALHFMKERKILNKELGIGLFMIPAPELGVLEYRRINVGDLSYPETVKRGENCKAFQWIPYGISMTSLNKTSTINSLEDFTSLEFNCDDSCRGGCPMGCMCWEGEVRCH